MRNLYNAVCLFLNGKSLKCKFLIFFFTGFALSSINTIGIAGNIEDRFFGIKFENISNDFNVELAQNDSVFTRIYFSSKTDKFIFIIYATKGNLKHYLTDKYDSILLSKYYKKPNESNSIEECGMKGTRNIYKYSYYNKEEKRHVDEYLIYDILYKPYFKGQEYFYLIYTYTTKENDSRVDYLKSMMQIEPPKISFWKTTFGIIIHIAIYIILGISLILFGRFIIRESYNDFKNGKIVKAILIFSIGLIVLTLVNVVVIMKVHHDTEVLTILGHLVFELFFLLWGVFLKTGTMLEMLWEAITD